MKPYIPSKKRCFLSFLLFVATAIALTVWGKDLARYSCLSKLDFQIRGYDIGFVTRLFTDYGLAGRNAYFWLTMFDMLFPFCVAFFGYCYFSYTWRKWHYTFVWFF